MQCPIRDGDTVIGVAAIDFKLDILQQVLQTDNISDTEIACILGEDGKVEMASTDQGIFAGINDGSVELNFYEVPGANTELLDRAIGGETGYEEQEFRDYGTFEVVFALNCADGLITGTMANPHSPEDLSPITGRLEGDAFQFTAQAGRTVYTYRGTVTAQGLAFDLQTNERIPLDPGKRLAGTAGELSCPTDTAVLEVKTGKEIPFWLVKILSRYGYRNKTFSKYCSYYLDMLPEDSLQGEYVRYQSAKKA